MPDAGRCSGLTLFFPHFPTSYPVSRTQVVLGQPTPPPSRMALPLTTRIAAQRIPAHRAWRPRMAWKGLMPPVRRRVQTRQRGSAARSQAQDPAESKKDKREQSKGTSLPTGRHLNPCSLWPVPSPPPNWAITPLTKKPLASTELSRRGHHLEPGHKLPELMPFAPTARLLLSGSPWLSGPSALVR